MYRLVSPLSIPSVDELSELTNEEVYNILQRDHAARRSTPHVTNNTTNTAQSDATTLQYPPLPMSTSAPAERVREERPAARFAQTTYTSTNKVEPVSLAGGPTSSHTITAQSVQRNSSASSSTAMTTALSRLMTPLSDAQLLEMERWRWRTLVQTGWFHQHVHHARWDEAWLRRGRLHRRRRLALQATTAVTMSHTRALCIALNIHPSLLETMESPCEARADMAGRRGGAPQVPQAGHGARKPQGRPRRVNTSASESENEHIHAEDKRRVHYGPAYDDDENDSSGAAVVEDDDDDEDEEEAGYDDYRSFFANERRRGLCDEVEDPAPYLFAWQLPAFIAGDVATTLGQIGSQIQAQYTTFATRPLPTIHLSVTRAGEVYQALSEARTNAGPEARVMFHYSAHGMPALQDGQLYFLHAVNSNRGSLATGMPYDASLREDMNVAADSAMYVRASVSTMLARLGLPLVFVADCVDAGAVLRELLRCYHDRLVTAAAMAAAVKASGSSNNNTKGASTTTPGGGGGAGRHGSRNVSSAELDALTNQNNNNNSVTSRGVHVGSGTTTSHTAALNSSSSSGNGAIASWTAPPRGALLFIGTADRANEGIHQLASPYRARLPADLLTSCLTTPIRMILLFFMIHHGRHNADLHPLLLHLLPGALQDRKTPLGQLHFFMQRLTENIAWSSLPIELYSLLFREDVHVAPLFRHYLIAEFLIVGKLGGKLVVYPPLPPMHQHPLWANVPCVLEVTLVSLLQAVRPRPAAVLSAMEYREWLDERITRWKYEQQQQQNAQAHWSRREAGRVSEQTGVAVEAGGPSSSSSSPLSPWTFLSAQAIAGSPALIIAAPTSPLPRITEDHPVQLISFLTEDLRSVEAAIDTLTTQAFCVPSQRSVTGRRGQTTVLTRSRRRPGTEPPRPTSTADLHDEEELNNDEQYGEDEYGVGYVESGDYRPFSTYRNSSLQQQLTSNVTHTNNDTTPLTRPASIGADGARATRHAAQSAHNNNDDDDTSRPVFPPLTLMPTLLQSLLVVSHREKGTELLCRFIDVGMPAVVQCAKANLYRIVLDHYWTRPDLRFLLPSTLFLFSKSCYVDPALIGSEKQRSIVIRVCTELLQSPVRLSATPRASSAPQPGTPQSMARRQGNGGEQTTNVNEGTTSNSSRTRMVSGSAASHTAHGTTGTANHAPTSKSVVQGAWQSVVLGDYATPAGQRLLACSLLSLLVLHDPAACAQCHELGVLQLCCQLLASSTRASQCSRTSGVGAAWRPQDENDTSSEETTTRVAAGDAGQYADAQAELDAAPPRAIATQYHMALLALFVSLVHRWRPATSQPAHDDVDNRDDDDEGGEGEGEDDVGLCVLQPLDGQVHTLPATNEHTLQASLQLVGPALERLLYDRASVLRGAAMRALAVTLVMPCASEAMRVPFVSIALRRLYEDGRPPACEANALVLFESTGLAETLVRWLVTRLSRELGSMESLTEFVTSYLARWLRQTRQLRPMTHPYLAVIRDGPGREPHITLAERGSGGQPGWGLAAISLQQALQDILAPANIKSYISTTGAADSSAHTSETTTSSTAPALMHTSHSVPHWVSHSATTTANTNTTTTTRANATRRLLQAEAARAAAHIRLGPPTRQPTQVMAYLTVLSNLVRLFIEHSYDCGPYASAKLRGVLNDELSFLFAPWFAQQQEERAGRPSARRDMRRGFTSQTAGHVAFHDLIAHTSNNNSSSSTFHSATVRAEAALLRPPSSSSSFAAAAAAAAVMAATDDELHRHSAVDVKEVWRELFTQVRQRVGGNYHDLHGRGVGRRCAGQQLERLRPRRPYHRTTAFNWDGVEGQTGMHNAPEPQNITTTTGAPNNNTAGNNAFLHLRHHTRQEGGRGATPWRLPIAPLPTSMNFAHFCPHKARHVQAFVFSALGYLSDLLLVPEDDMDSRHPYHARTTEALHDYLTVLSNGLHSSTALDGLAQPPGLSLSNDEDVSLETQSMSRDDNKEANNSTTDRPQVTSSTSTYRKTRNSASSLAADINNSVDNTICPYVQLCTSREGSQTVPGDVTHFLFHPSQPHTVACTDRGFVRIYEYGVSTHRQRAFLRPSSTYHIADVVARAGPLSYTTLQLRYRYRTRCYAREYAASHSEDDDETSSSCDSRSSASKAEPRGVDEDNEGAQSDQDDDDAASRQTAVYHSHHGSQRPSLPSQAASEEAQANDDNASEGSVRGEHEDNGGREEGRGQKDSRDGRRPGRLSSPHHTSARPAERRTASMPDSRPAFHNGISGMHLIDAAYETILCTIRRTGAVELFTQYTHSGTVRRLSTFETAQLGLCGHQTQDRLSSYQPQSSLLYLSSGETSVAAWDLQTEQLDTLYSAAPASSIIEAASVLQAHPAEPRQCALAAGGVYVFDLRSPQPRLFVSPLAQSTSSSLASSACFSAGAQPRTSSAAATSLHGAASAFASPVCVHVNFSLRYPHALFTGYSGGMVLVWDDRTTRTPLYTYSCTNSSPANSIRNGCHGVSEVDEDDGGLHGTRFMEVHACSKNLLTLAVRANTLFITEPWQAGNNGPMKHCQYALPSGGEASVAVFHPYRPLLAIGGWGGSRMALYGRQQVC